MNVKGLLACLVVTAGTAGMASAQIGSYTLDWRVNGADSISVNPGAVVLVTATANWAPATTGLGSTQMRVNLANSDASDALQYSEALGLGRNASLRLLPQALVDSAIVGGRAITGAANTVIDAGQLPQMVNPLFNAGNPIEVFRFMFVAGAAGRTVDIASPLTAVNLYANAQGFPTLPYSTSVDGAHIQIVPAPGAMALLGTGGVVAIRRRRRS
jgi:hypothetical protein